MAEMAREMLMNMARTLAATTGQRGGLRYWLAGLLGMGLLLQGSQAALAADPPALRVPLIRAPQADRPIRLVAADLQVEAAGTLVTSRLSLTFLNPNGRPLEGELRFPLADGQSVTGFALESLDGHMLAAVPVKKSRGQEVFEAVERRQVDPALLERTEGNNFRLRIYPLPPGKTRRVSLEISELLAPDPAGRVHYRLPLDLGAGQPFHLNFVGEVHGVDAGLISTSGAIRGARLTGRHGDALAWLEQAAYPGNVPAGLSWPAPGGPLVFSDRFDGETYFHAEVPVTAPSAPRPDPSSLALIWDASGSGAGRDHTREFALLEAYFKRFAQLRVQLSVVRDRAEPPRAFTVRAGDWSELRATLERIAYDGASNPALLFSDGLGNWGETAPGRSGPPLFAIHSGGAVNAERLRGLAESSGGQYLDLGAMGEEQALADALDELLLIRPVFHTAHVSGIEDLAAPSLYPRRGRLTLAGRLTRAGATLNYSLRLPDGRFQHHQLRIPDAADAGPAAGGLAAKRWATYRIAQLEAEPRLHEAEIEALGRRFGLISSQTSLLVLESLEDHLRYQVPPPAGPWRAGYEARLAAARTDTPARRSAHLDDLARRFAQMVAWWEKDYPKDKPPKPVQPAVKAASPGELMSLDAQRRDERMPRPLARMASPAPANVAVTNAAAAPEALAGGEGQGAAATIHLQAWNPDAAYARRLREADDASRYAVYLDERPGHAGSTAFFLDAADVFFAKGQTDLAVRVLSNLAEMDLENRHVLRVLAYRLQQAGQIRLALPLLRRVRDLAPEEPQSWRDLGLALVADGQAQAALDILWETVSRPWDARFSDLDLTALAELNALVARAPGLDTHAIDRRLLRNLPLDLRAVLAWDADNTDIDLWVIDPNGEKTYYQAPLSYQGGRLSADFTAGYGPETFSLRTAKPGRYEIRAQFYGHRQQVLMPYTTLMLRLSTGFGTPGQKDQDIVLRLSEAKEEVLVGSFQVEARP